LFPKNKKSRLVSLLPQSAYSACCRSKKNGATHPAIIQRNKINMTRFRDRKYFIVKHPLDALEALPNFIWNSYEQKSKTPRLFARVKEGDRWIAFAYTTSDARERSLSLITGFYECTRKARHGKIPKKALSSCTKGETEAWLIEGRDCGQQPGEPVGVPPINDLLNRQSFNMATLVPISAQEFEKIRTYTLKAELNPDIIPFLGREPKSEQELVALVSNSYEKLGIERIVRVQTRFPDFLVKIKGKADEVFLELELYSKNFLAHGHARHSNEKGCFPIKSERNTEKKPVEVLCWIDND